MTITRRTLIAGTAVVLAAPHIARPAFAAVSGRALPIPPLADTSGGVTTLDAAAGESPFLDGARTPTWGFSQPFLGPVLRFRRGETAHMRVTNRLRWPITSHWHGLHVPAIVDGGPMLEIAPGDTWDAELQVDQPAATLWYHSHSHGVTAEQVYLGLAGMIIVDDDTADAASLPSDYGVDDLPLAIQDRAFASDASFSYIKAGPALMHGFRADHVMVNGAIRPLADVPAGIVRLRLLNASNSRIYHLRFADGRTFHHTASDGGLLPAPVAVDRLTLAPAERVEVLVDFSGGEAVTLLSGPDVNDPMGGIGGMMGGMLPGAPPQADEGDPGEFEVMRFRPDPARVARVTAIPERFASAPPVRAAETDIRRDFMLDMHVGNMGGGGMGGGMMGGGMMGGRAMGMMGINGQAYDPARVDVPMRRGVPEIWRVRAMEMAHPFHVHGTQFQVLTMNGEPVPFARTGLKDVVLVEGEAELLLQVDHDATAEVPFMYHCHILEHEDAGMMGQFTVV